ncbi:MAG: flagellar biosynthetic protein FliR [Clostridia bacterium]|nr:flagellar biosynthetic protein FliR [Clostridia bacterium]MBQ3076433.1 flagellar biosynthetic protein FliR [Clostridia bacterium]
MVDYAALTLYLYILARVSGVVLFNPILGRSNLPNLYRGCFILVLSVFTASLTVQTVTVPQDTPELMVRILAELLTGLLLGMAMQFFFYIPQLMGFTVDTQMGMTMNQIYDAGQQTNMSVTGVIINVLMMLLFFAGNGHHTLIRILMTSGDVVPFGEVRIGTAAASYLLELFCQCTVMAVKMSMPILTAELLGQLGMGVLMKVIPQINVFAINIDVKVIIGLVMLLMLISPFSEFLLQAENQMLRSLSELLRLTAAG